MESFILTATTETPGFVLEPASGYLELNGNSTMNNPEEFYNQVEAALDEYGLNPAPMTQMVFHLQNFNVSSSKKILFLLYKLAELKSRNHYVAVSWYYEKNSDVLYEMGKDFAFMMDFPFEFHCCEPATPLKLSI